MKDNILTKALKNNYAVGAFNFNNVEILKAIINAANNLNAPVIAQISKGAIEFAGVEYLKAMISAAKTTAKTNLVFNLDHGDSLEIVKTAIYIGCDMVMIDASSKPYEENIKLTKEVVDYAHSHGVIVEAELGKLAGIEDHVNVDLKDSSYTDPIQAKDFVLRTGVDFLAVAIGTSHGAYKFSGDAELRFDILKQIQELLPNTPLVLHGASSVDKKSVERFTALGGNIKGAKGVPEEILAKASKLGVCKVNCDTDLRLEYTTSLLEHIKNNPTNIDPRKYLKYATDNVQKIIEQKIINLGGQNKN